MYAAIEPATKSVAVGAALHLPNESAALQAALDELVETYPLESCWGAPRRYVETVEISGVRLGMCGLVVRDGQGRQATGSAAGLDAIPIARAYFELVERTSVLGAIERDLQDYPVIDRAGRQIGVIAKDRVFPRSDDEAEMRYARSNGVAAHVSWEQACCAAALELIERDRVLRSWYGLGVPRRITIDRHIVLERLAPEYSFEAYAFDGAAANVAVYGVFAYPRSSDAPLTYGFAASESPSSALTSAVRECLQRLAFLWGESIPKQEPEFAPTPEYHQEFFLQPSMHERLRKWLAGEHARFQVSGFAQRALEVTRLSDRFVDLTPNKVRARLRIVRALPESELPLVFGRGHPDLDAIPAPLAVHPLA